MSLHIKSTMFLAFYFLGIKNCLKLAFFLLPSYILSELNLGVYVGFLLGRLTILEFPYQKEITTGLIF